MANEQNLVRGDDAHKLTAEEASKGGKASGEARRRKRDLRRALEMLLEKDYKDKSGNTASGAEVVTAKLFEKALKGDTRAFELVRDTVGQKPVEQIKVQQIDKETSRKELEEIFSEDDE